MILENRDLSRVSKLSNIFSVEFSELIKNYKNTKEHNYELYKEFYEKVNSIDFLKAHRDYVEENKRGYGDRPFHYMWKVIVEQLPDSFSFLEIGVFKGQVISLVNLLGSKLDKVGKFVGVTPLEGGRQDKYGKHPDDNYMGMIKQIHNDFDLSMDNTHIIKGYSSDPTAKEESKKNGEYDVVYIDGCHDYEVVVDDIKTYSSYLKKGGFLIIDDASCYLEFPEYIDFLEVEKRKFIFFKKKKKPGFFKGLEDVCNAVRDCLENNNNFVELFACGHNRVWIKIK